MAETKIESKSEFATLVAKMKQALSTFESDSDKVANAGTKAEDYDGIPVSSAANKLKSNFDNIKKDMSTAITNINNYANDILGFDVNDFLANGGEVSIKYEDLFKSDGSAEGNAQVIWNFLKYKGLSDAAAAGVLGNIQAECSFRLDAVGDGGTSYGLIQWHNGRWDNLRNYCAQHGLDPSTLQGQLEFLWAESLDPNTSYGRGLTGRGFYTTNSAVDAAVAFHDVVERSASSAETVRNKRGGYAQNWYNKFNGTGPGNVDGSLTLSSKNWTSLANGSSSSGYSSSGAYVSSGSSGSYYSGSPSTSSTPGSSTTTTTTTPTTTTEPETTTPTRDELIDKMEEIKAEKVKLNFGKSDVDISKFSDDEEAGYRVTTGHMSYELTDDDIDLLCSVVAASGGKGYNDSLAIVSSILNRCEDKAYMNIYGVDPIAQITAKGEMSAYGSGDFKSYLKNSSSIPSEVRDAVKAALAGVRNHNKTTFDLTAGSGSGSGSSDSSVGTTSAGSLLDDLRKANEEFRANNQGNVVPDGEKAVEPSPEGEIIDNQLELDELGIKVKDNELIIE